MTHRYVGIVVGLLMLMWFASGVVMLFAHWPEVTEAERTQGLAPIAWAGCCHVGDMQDPVQVTTATLEDLAGHPVLRVDGEALDLATGAMVHAVSAADAVTVARTYARAHGIALRSAAPPQRVERDQWTVTGYFDKRRPFWLVHGDDPRHTDIYVSAHTGQVSQVTDRPTRILSWLGPIPHWLYPQALRADTRLWSQVVIWTSIVGVFLTVTGLYLGIVAWRPWGDRRLSPFRGLMVWHHLTGLFAGALTLTWVASGLVSMNPWGFLDSQGDPRAERVSGGMVGFGELRLAIQAAQAQGVSARQLKLAPLDGEVFLMADGVRLDADGKPAPLATAQLAAVAGRLGRASSAGLMTREDQYYRGHHEPVELPVYRVILPDGARFYFDPASGQLKGAIDGNARGYRWLFEGLHRFDFIDGQDRGAGWAAAMVLLLVLAGAGVATGVWLGWRRAKSDVAGLFKRSAPKPG